MSETIAHASISDVVAMCLKRYPDYYHYQKGHGLVKIVNHPTWGTLFYAVDVMKEFGTKSGTKWIFHHKLIDQ